MGKPLKWDERATAVFTQYELDRELGLEKDDPNEDVRGRNELR